MSNVIRIVLADDHPVVRNGLRRAIEEDADFEVVAEAGDGAAALALMEEHKPELAVLDIEMPKMSGLDTARRMAALKLTTKVIFLTLHKDEDFFRAAMDAGARGYLLKESAMQEIVEGLHAVAENRVYISAGVATNLIEQEIEAAPRPLDVLTAQLTLAEKNILKLIAEGKSSKEIGEELSINYRTVENHRTNSCRKLGVEGANALLRFALQHRHLM